MRWYERKTGELVEGATLRDARKQGYLPSVTGIIGDMFHSYGLAKWRFKLDLQMLASQAERGIIPMDVALAEYEGARAREEMMQDHTAMHERIAKAWSNVDIAPHCQESPVVEYLPIVSDLYRKGVTADCVEQRLVSQPLGYCGQPDAYGPDLIDWKFTTRGEGGYRDKLFAHGIQLAAYNELIPLGAERWINVIISAKDPAKFHILEWSKWEQAHLTEVWRCAFRLWCLRNKYDPRSDAAKMRGGNQMKFRTRWEALDPEQKKELAKRMETTTNYLSQIAHGHAKPGREMLRTLVKECEGYTREDAAEDLLS